MMNSELKSRSNHRIFISLLAIIAVIGVLYDSTHKPKEVIPVTEKERAEERRRTEQIDMRYRLAKTMEGAFEATGYANVSITDIGDSLYIKADYASGTIALQNVEREQLVYMLMSFKDKMCRAGFTTININGGNLSSKNYSIDCISARKRNAYRKGEAL